MGENILDETLKKVGLISNVDEFDFASFLKDRKEMEQIAEALPSDGVYDVCTINRLMRLVIRGMNICDDWIPKLHVLLSCKEIDTDKLYSKAYIETESKTDKKLTVEMRKSMAEMDEKYTESKLITQKILGAKTFYEKKRETLKTAFFMFKEQLDSYKLSDKGNSGEELQYNDTMSNKIGKIAW